VSRRQAGDSAAADVADKSEPAIHIDRERAPGTLATGARRTLARIDSDVLILSGNFHAPGFLGLSDTAREQSKPKQNEQFAHSSLHKDIPTWGSTITIIQNAAGSSKPRFFWCFPRVNSGNKLPFFAQNGFCAAILRRALRRGAGKTDSAESGSTQCSEVDRDKLSRSR